MLLVQSVMQNLPMQKAGCMSAAVGYLICMGKRADELAIRAAALEQGCLEEG